MNKALVVLVLLCSLVGVVFVIDFFIGVNAHNYANKTEEQIIAQYEQNRNSLSNTTNKVRELFSVRDEHYEGLKNIIEANMEGRYGENGSQAIFQFLTEQNLSPNHELDIMVSQALQAGRNEFSQSQKMLIDLRRGYRTEINSYFFGQYIKRKGFPKIDLDKYDIIVESSVKDKFEEKIDTQIKLR